MIHITHPEACCGCEACVQACPKQCIALEADAEGFAYPVVDAARCVDCGLCERVCPELHVGPARRPLAVYAAAHPDAAVLAASSSGGVFTLLAERTIERGGVVFGVRFDADFRAVFAAVERADELDSLRRSKYVQAHVGTAYADVQRLLRQGRQVLFTGTPCQVAALRSYLRRDYEGLTTCDVLCEGVPSPALWRRYLDEELTRMWRRARRSGLRARREDVRAESVSLRDKRRGWRHYAVAITASAPDGAGGRALLPESVSRDSAYLQALFRCLALRPACYACPFKDCRSGSDLTIGDYWGIDRLHPEMDDGRGTSLVHVHTERGAQLLPLEALRHWATNFDEGCPFNNIERPAPRHPRRDAFYAGLPACRSVIGRLEAFTYTPADRAKLLLRRLLNPDRYEKLKRLCLPRRR